MKNAILTLIALGLSAAATATTPKPPKGKPAPVEQNQQQGQSQTAYGGKGGSGGDATSGSESAAAAISGSASQAVVKTHTVADASNALTVDGSQSLTSDDDVTLTVQGDELTVEGDELTIEGDNWDLPSNSAYAPNGFSVIECSAVLGAAFTNRKGSGSLGLPIPRWLDRLLFQRITDCESNADAVWLAEFGLKYASIEARCQTSSMQRMFGGGKKKKERAKECVAHLKSTIIEEDELQQVLARIRHLEQENEKLLTDLKHSRDSGERCTEAWTECQAK